MAISEYKRAYNISYRNANRPRMQELWKDHRARRLAANNKFIRDHKEGHPCACGESDHIALDFHHTDPASKNGTIEKLRKYSRARLEAEMAKCVVLCANCHRKGHAGRPRPEHISFFTP